jgi:hypothetical protein
MTDKARLIEVAREISAILKNHGQVDFATKIDGQIQTLADPSISEETLVEVKSRLRGSIHGMGGLLDLWLAAPTHAESVQAREDLDALCDDLSELTR